MALLPPPTQAMTTSGSLPSFSKICALDSLLITLWKSLTIVGNGCGPITEPSTYKVSSTLAVHSCIQALTASFNVFVPLSTACTFAPSSSIRYTFNAWRIVSSFPMKISHSIPNSAAAVAVATPCCPAPVSAISLVLPIFLARSAWPSTLLILCEPVWFKSSLLK